MIMESMELVRLPSPPQLLSKLLDLCQDPDSSLPELVDLISCDVALSSKLIMAVNSDAFSINQPVNNLEHAVTLLGHELVKTMVLTSSMQQLFAGLIRTQKEFVCNAWLDSLYCAIFARDIAQSLHYENLQDAYLAGLLHDFGQIVFDARFHEQYVDIISAEEEAETIRREEAQFGLGHAELGAGIIEAWPSLSPAIADAVRFHHEDEEQLAGADILCQILAEASQLARQWSRHGKSDGDWRSRLVDDKELKLICFHARDKLAQVAASIGVGLSKSGSLTREVLFQDIEREILRFARKIRDASLIKVINTGDSESSIGDSPRSLLLKVAREMQLLFSVSDIALLMPDEEKFNCLALYEVRHKEPISRFSIEGNKSQIMRSYLERRSLWIEAEPGKTHPASLSDRQIIRRLNHDIAYSLPLGHGNQVIGVIVIGTGAAQKRTLENLSKFISGYLKNIADAWLDSKLAQQQQSFSEKTRKEQGQKDLDKLVHEIGNPLSVIANYIDIIRGNSKSNGKQHDREFNILKEELQRIEHIVIDFKEAKGAESLTVLLNYELEKCIPLYVKSFSNGRDVNIEWKLDAKDAEVQITRDGLRQIVLNLVKNAVEAQHEAVEIQVSSHAYVNFDGAAFAQFTISDQGGGVDSDTRNKLFTPMNSAKEGFSRGLGLSVVADILGDFDGQVKFMENEFGGASFEVLIPLRLTQ